VGGYLRGRQGLTLVHFSAQPEPYLTRNAPCTPQTPPDTCQTPAKTTPTQSLNAPPIPQKALTLSRKVDECKPLVDGTRCADFSCGTDPDGPDMLLPPCGDASTGSYTLLSCQGRVVHVDPMKPTLKAHGAMRLRLKYDKLFSSFAFKFKLCRFTKMATSSSAILRCAWESPQDRCFHGSRRLPMGLPVRLRATRSSVLSAPSASKLAGAYTRPLSSST